jgi:hypothetical protein
VYCLSKSGAVSKGGNLIVWAVRGLKGPGACILGLIWTPREWSKWNFDVTRNGRLTGLSWPFFCRKNADWIVAFDIEHFSARVISEWLRWVCKRGSEVKRNRGIDWLIDWFCPTPIWYARSNHGGKQGYSLYSLGFLQAAFEFSTA